MLVGATIDPREYDRRVPLYPASRMCRVFGYAAKGMPTWAPQTGDRRVAHLHELVPGIVPALVFQDWPSDGEVGARVATLLDEIDGPARLCWNHEADRKNTDPTLYRRRYYLLAEWLQDHRNGLLVDLTPTATYQWTMSVTPGKGGGDWSKFYAGIGRAGIDVYADSWRPDYPDPEVFLSPLWRFRDVIGEYVELPEFGAARLASDPTGQRRADWLVACADIMATEGVTAVSYWDDMGSNGTDLRLWGTEANTPEYLAWSDVMHRYNTPVVGSDVD